MALDPVFPKTPQFAVATVTAANTNNDGTGEITTLLTAGDEGSLITNLHCNRGGTSTATQVRLFISLNNGTTWKLLDVRLLAAYTVSPTTLPVDQIFVDRINPNSSIRLPAHAKIGVTIAVAQSAGVNFLAEYMDY